MTRPLRAAGVLALALAAACATKEKEIESDRRYISTVYNDTIVESFGRTSRTITGLLVEKSGDTVRFRVHTKADALVSTVDLTLHAASRRGQRPVTQIVTMPTGTLPLMQNSVAFLEQYLRRDEGCSVRSTFDTSASAFVWMRKRTVSPLFSMSMPVIVRLVRPNVSRTVSL